MRADPHATDVWNSVPWQEALHGNHGDVWELLQARLDNAPAPRLDKRVKMETISLCCAAASGNLAELRTIHSANGNINACDYDGRTPLHIAIATGHLEVARWLVDSGALTDIRDDFGMDAVAQSVRSMRNDIIAVVQGSDQPVFPADKVHVSAALGLFSISDSQVDLGRELSRKGGTVVRQGTWQHVKVAVKTTDEAVSESGKFLNEINMYPSLRHPNVVLFLGDFVDGSRPLFISELMEEGNLSNFFQREMKNHGDSYQPSADLCMRWALAISRALSYLHDRPEPIIHRDLNPSNLLLNGKHDLKLSDFGSSMHLKNVATGRTAHGVLEGSWYVAPEEVRELVPTEKVDIFSFGLVLSFINTGVDPFVNEFREAEALYQEYLKGKEPRPAVRAGFFCRKKTLEIQQLMQASWHEDPVQRPSSKTCAERTNMVVTLANELSFKVSRAISWSSGN